MPAAPTPEQSTAPHTPLDLAIDQAAAAVRRKLHEVLTTTRFGMVTVEVRNGQVYVGGGATVRIQQCTDTASWAVSNE